MDQTTQDLSVSSSRLPGAGELFSSAWNFTVTHWEILVGIVLVPFVFRLIGILLMLTHNVAADTLAVLCSLAYFIFILAMAPALIDAVAKLYDNSGNKISIKQQYGVGFKLFWSFVFLSIIAALSYAGSAILFIVPGFIVAIYISMQAYTLVIDGKRGYAALTESYSLVRGRWWAVLWRLLFMAVVILLIYIVIGLLLLMILGSGDMYKVVTSLVQILLGLFIVPFSVAYYYKLYLGLKPTRQANISTGTFKNWLIAFTIIGVLVIVVAVVLLAMLRARMVQSLSSPMYNSSYVNTPYINNIR